MSSLGFTLMIVGALVVGAGGRAASAAELRLGSEPYRYTVIDQDLRIALREFGANVGVRVAVSDAVQGRIRGRLPPLAPQEFLSKVAELYGLDWYFDGFTVSITAQTEGLSKVIPNAGLTFPQLKAGLDALGVTDERFLLRPQGADANLVLIAGPPRYIQLAEQATAELVAQAAARPRPSAPGATVVASAPGLPRAAPPRPTGLRVFRAGQEQTVLFDPP